MLLVIWTICGIFALVMYAQLRDPHSQSLVPDILVMLLAGPVGWAILVAVLMAYFGGERKTRV